MSNQRYYVDPDFINPYFSEKEIEFWNAWLKDNYRVYRLFREITRNRIAARTKYLSARDIIAKIRMEKHWKIINASSTFLAFTFCMQFPQHFDKFKILKRKQIIETR